MAQTSSHPLIAEDAPPPVVSHIIFLFFSPDAARHFPQHFSSFRVRRTKEEEEEEEIVKRRAQRRGKRKAILLSHFFFLEGK